MERTALYRALERWERPLFFALLLAHLFVVWYMPVFLTQDGPSHLYNARILLELWNGDPTGLYSTFFTLNTNFSPNWTGNILLAGLLKFLPAIAAEKALVSIYMIALPLAFRHAVRVMGGTAPILSSLIFLLTYNHHLVYGFFNFCLSLAVLFWFIAAFHQFMHRRTWLSSFGCALLLLLMLATHPVALLVGFAVIMSGVVVRSIEAARTKAYAAAIKDIFTFALIALPAGVLFLVFLPTSDIHPLELFANTWSLPNWYTLLRLHHAVIFDGAEIQLFKAIALVIGALFFSALLVILRKRRGNGSLSTMQLLFLPPVLVFCVCVHFFVVDELAGGAYLTSRIALIAYMLFFAWLASLPMTAAVRSIGLGFIALFGIVLLVIRYPAHAQCGEQAAAYIAQCATIPDGSTFLPLCFSDRGQSASGTLSPRISVFKHMSGYVAADRPLISLDNYEANTAYFQTAWRPEVNPFMQLCASGDCNIEGEPTTADIMGYEKRTQRNIDFVILWGYPASAAQRREYAEFMLGLGTLYGHETPASPVFGLFGDGLFAKRRM